MPNSVTPNSVMPGSGMIVSWPCLLGDVVYQARPQPDEANQDQVDRDDDIQKARDQQDQDTGDQRNERLDNDNIEGHGTGSVFSQATGTGMDGGGEWTKL
jgi:hypothetical protein